MISSSDRQRSFSVETREQEPYLTIPLTVARCPWLTPVQKTVLIALWSWCHWKRLEGAPTYAKLALSANITERSVATALKALADMGVISIRVMVANGRKRPFYRIHNDIFSEWRQTPPSVDNSTVDPERISTVGGNSRQVDPERISTVGGKLRQVDPERISSSTIQSISSLSDMNIKSQILRFESGIESGIESGVESGNDRLKNNMISEDLRRLGISEVTISKLVREYTTEQLQDAYYRCKGKGHNPAGYFLTVLRNQILPGF